MDIVFDFDYHIMHWTAVEKKVLIIAVQKVLKLNCPWIEFPLS